MEEPSLSLLQHSLITPASPSPQRSLFLSASDLMCSRLTYNRRILFFRISPEDYPFVIQNLKRSLSTVLVDFYPLAGRLSEGESGRLEVLCNDLGAEFVEAALHGVSMSDWEVDDFEMRPFFERLTQWATHPPEDVFLAPLLSIQVTRFKCGSIALGMAHSHVLADGHSLWHFMTSWAECARGESVSMTPVHTRTLLKVDNPCENKARIDLEEIEAESSEQLKQEDIAKAQRVFSFTKEMMRRLKERARGGFSSYEVLVAHIWKCVTRARSHARDKKVGFLNVVNMRKRMDPPFPEGYFGNLLNYTIAVATAGELQDEDLTTTAARIHVSITSCTSLDIERLLHWLELHGPAALFARGCLNDSRMRVSSSQNFPVYRTNFGWGTPLAVRSAVVEELGQIVLYPRRDGPGSIDVCMALPMLVIHRLSCDPTFTHKLSSSV